MFFKEVIIFLDRKKFIKKYEREKFLMDGVYIEFKCVQDVLLKFIKVKRIEIENCLKVGIEGEDLEDVVFFIFGEI